MLTTKTVVITGASGALGNALVRKLVLEQAIVVAIDRDLERLEALHAELKKTGAEFHAFVCDLLDPEQLAKTLSVIDARFPKIDIWINNAGMTAVGGFLDQPEAVWEKVMELNFTVCVRLTRHVLKKMSQQGQGQIVMLASVAGAVPAAWMTAYTASKHALVGFTRALQEELRQQNSHVNVLLVTPGFFDSSLILSKAASFPEWLRPILGTPQAVAGEILSAIKSRRRESTPTWNGKLLLRVYRSFPRMVTRSSKVLLTRHPLDLLLNRYEIPRHCEAERPKQSSKLQIPME